MFENKTLKILYDVPLALEEQGLADVVCERFGFGKIVPDLAEWKALSHNLSCPKGTTTIALVGKYVALHDAYLSVVESLTHAGALNHTKVKIKWVEADEVTAETAEEIFSDVEGILVPGGFGTRGTEGKIEAAKYARENKIPFFGICLGMQIAMIEFARNVIGLVGANSSELDPSTPYPVVDLMPEQENVTVLGGTMRLGKYPCELDEKSKSYGVYGEHLIYERHRHRYEINNKFREQFEEHGIILAGLSPDKRIVEMIEIIDHPWFVACQFHPEFKSRPNRPHPLFFGFIRAARSKTDPE